MPAYAVWTRPDKLSLDALGVGVTAAQLSPLLVELDGVDFARMARKPSGGCCSHYIAYKHRSITTGGRELDVVMRTKTNL